MNQAMTQTSRLVAAPAAHDHEVPSIAGALIFRLKAFVLQGQRMLRNIWSAPRWRTGQSLVEAQVLAQSSTPLGAACNPAEIPLLAGKIQNLRIATRQIDGVEIPANEVFSFWSQVGRPSRRKGYARGRELRQGCLIPTIGGGLCQLSNALYQCALESGFEIVERHAHSQVVPGSAAEFGMDATVFWNYVDLRFRSSSAFRIEAQLAGEHLVVRFKGMPARRPGPRSLRVMAPISSGPSPSSCASCGVASCFRHEQDTAGGSSLSKTAYLVDEYWPEFDNFIKSHRQPQDVIGLPLKSKLFRRLRYGWDTSRFERVRTANVLTLERSLKLRRVPPQGASRQRILLEYDRKFAKAFARLLTFDVTHVVVAQSLLPFLWSEGHLAARTFDVLMTRLPLHELQVRLDSARDRHPESTTLGDFRAGDEIVEVEREALAAARNLITPHTEIASLFGRRAVLLDWQFPEVEAAHQPIRGAGILFPASTLGRKGAYEIREAARMLNLELTIAGRELEGPAFWEGIPIRRPGEEMLEGIGLVVLPAYVEDKPRVLLWSVACGIPVIASPACGLEHVRGVLTLPALDAGILAAEISAFVNASQQETHSRSPLWNKQPHLHVVRAGPR